MESESAALGAATLPDALAELARGKPETSVVYPGPGIVMTARELWDAARAHASGLVRAGVRPGEVVGLLAPAGPALPVSVFGVTLAGAAISVLPTGLVVTDARATLWRLARIVDAAGMRHVLASDEYATLAAGLRALRPDLTILDPAVTGPPGTALPGAGPGSLAVVQFTSGSTSRPKGVMLQHRNVMAGLRGLVAAVDFGPGATLVNWVPHFHDMGLFMQLASLIEGRDFHVFSPLSFVRSPESFLAYFAEHGGTITACPNFAYDLLAGATAGLPEGSLRRWRMAINGAEPVLPATMDRFAAEFAPLGVGPAVMSPGYGMAEATLSVALSAPDEVARTVHVNRNLLADRHQVSVVSEGDPAAKAVVSVGRPTPGISLRIAGGNGAGGDRAGENGADEDGVGDRGEGRLGEIQLRGSSVTSGYLGEPAATAALFDDGWLRTGDLGFLLDGRLYVTSRIKDMIIVDGRNYFPEDAEEIATAVPGVSRGRCVAFASRDDGVEAITVVAEGARRADPAELAARIRREVVAGLGLAAVSVQIVGPGRLPRTTSGKKQRALTRDRLGSHGPEPASPGARPGMERNRRKDRPMTIPAQISRDEIAAVLNDALQRELGVPQGSFNEGTAIADLPGADSARQLRVIARTEKRFGVTVGDENTAPAATVGGFVDQVASALGNRYSG